MNATMSEGGPSARIYARDVMLDLNDFIIANYPSSRVAVMGMNVPGGYGLKTDERYTFIQYQTDFLNAAQYLASRQEIVNAFNIPPANLTEDLSSFFKTANQKMEGVENKSTGGLGGVPVVPIIPREWDKSDPPTPVIVFMSDFQIPNSQNGGGYWTSSMKEQSNRFDTYSKGGILQTVRFNHFANTFGGSGSNADYSTPPYDSLMRTYVSPAGRSHWGFTKVSYGASYTEALNKIKNDFLTLAPPGDGQGSIITDVVPEGLEVNIASISHGGEYDPVTRTITWDLSEEYAGEITVSFKATVKDPGEYYNSAHVEYPGGGAYNTNTTYHRMALDNVDVTITKTVRGAFADMTRSFEFTIYFMDGSTNQLAAGTTLFYEGGSVHGSGVNPPPNDSLTLEAGGKATFNLKHGQSITIKDLQSDYWVQIVETSDGSYNASFTYNDDQLGEVSKQSVFTDPIYVDVSGRTIDFVNTRALIPPTGIDLESTGLRLLLLATLIILLSLATVWLMRRRLWMNEK